LSIAATQAALLCGGAAWAQTAGTPPASAASAAAGDDQGAQTIVVTGQRAALQSAQKIKQNSEDIVDGVVAEEAGKLPDKSITEVLQRVVGVSMDRNRSHGDPEHFSVEGSGVQVRGLSWGSSTLNGRESFSAGWPGRELSWGDVPPELMSAVIVHKNPPAELIEGGVSGQVDLRTALPFDYKDKKIALSLVDNYNELGSKNSPGISGLYSQRWSNDHGQWGALIDLSFNQTNTHNDTVEQDAYYPRTDIVNGQTVWVPKSASWRTNTSQVDRGGIYGALQWKKNDMQSSLTYFHSAFKESGTENAMFTAVENPYKTQVVNPVFDANGVLQTGTLTYPSGGLGANNFAAGGLGFNVDAADDVHRSQTREIAWNFKWTINDRWAVQQDLQWVHATDSSEGGDMALGTFVPSMGIDTTKSPVGISFDQAARDFLANPANYYLDHIMPSRSKADGDLYAWAGDAKFKFDDAVLRDLRFGVRFTDRKTEHINASGTGWYSIAQPWNVKQTSVPGQLPSATDPQGWQSRATMGYFSDPRYAGIVPTTTYNFNNFFNGKVGTPPTLVAPAMNFIHDPANYPKVIPILGMECQDGNQTYGTSNDCSSQGSDWKPLTYDGDPANTSRQSEQTQAAYTSLRFGFDDWRHPVEGEAGARVVRTHTVAHGYTVFKPSYDSNTPPEVPQFGQINQPMDMEHTYTDVLPSLNLKMSLTDKLQTRFAFAQSMYRPGFDSLSEYITLNQNITNNSGTITNITYTGNDTGNVNLKPIRANNYDLTLEWYPRSGSSLTAAVFYKDVKDIILPAAFTRSYADLAGNQQNFLITAPGNVAKGSVGGLELAGQTYFDQLPGLDKLLPDWAKGFGISANYTYLDSKQKLYHPFSQKYCPASGSFNDSTLNVYGCDTNGLPFTDLPIMYLSRNAYNLEFLYDKGPLSARLAYSWRGRFLQGVTVNGTEGSDGTSADPARAGAHDVGWGLPTWQEATGQWDAGFDYKYTEHLSMSLSATNLTDIVIRQTQEQHIGNMGRAWFEPGRSYRLTLRYDY
jgi:TonB-dependent receptor